MEVINIKLHVKVMQEISSSCSSSFRSFRLTEMYYKWVKINSRHDFKTSKKLSSRLAEQQSKLKAQVLCCVVLSYASPLVCD